MSKTVRPFSLGLSGSIKNPLLRPLAAAFEPALERLLALSNFNRLYLKSGKTDCYCTEALELLNVSYSLADGALERIPSSGPAVIVANHPFGGIEGILLASLLRKRRPDSKILANFLIDRVPEMADYFIYVDPFGSSSAKRKNLQPMREALEWVKSGGLLTVFPSGTVSHWHWKQRRITDPEWQPSVARLIRRTGAPVVPVFFEGNNGLAFQAAGIVHPLLRTALIPRELWNKRNSELALRIGNPIPPEKLRRFECDEELVSYLRLRTYLLSGSRQESPTALAAGMSELAAVQRKLQPIVPAVDPEAMALEIQQLPEEQILDTNSEYLVAFARAPQIPLTLREIGRLREVTFRMVQEGTGRSIDLDRYDNYYLHLFVWNRQKKEIVGAYRLVQTDRVLKTFGISGLYTSTLFDYGPQLLKQMGPALELGRSFVRPEYQRNYNSLNLLWRGIALFAAKHPRYRILFGTVSISSEYESVSRQLIMSFLKANNYLPELARLIRARNPMKRVSLHGLDAASKVVRDIQGVSELIREIEADTRGMPILLKQYLRLGGKLLGFNIDENFGNVLDGLIYVDLLETDTKILERYLGEASLKAFLDYHRRSPTEIRTGTCD